MFSQKLVFIQKLRLEDVECREVVEKSDFENKISFYVSLTFRKMVNGMFQHF